nr:MAG TPA: hypothetical protein [Caudoviricetes sp.]DAU28871.1 MAG TPA: hypothetical protein [Caudoviricetes sp.]
MQKSDNPCIISEAIKRAQKIYTSFLVIFPS